MTEITKRLTFIIAKMRSTQGILDELDTLIKMGIDVNDEYRFYHERLTRVTEEYKMLKRVQEHFYRLGG